MRYGRHVLFLLACVAALSGCSPKWQARQGWRQNECSYYSQELLAEALRLSSAAAQQSGQGGVKTPPTAPDLPILLYSAKRLAAAVSFVVLAGEYLRKTEPPGYGPDGWAVACVLKSSVAEMYDIVDDFRKDASRLETGIEDQGFFTGKKEGFVLALCLPGVDMLHDRQEGGTGDIIGCEERLLGGEASALLAKYLEKSNGKDGYRRQAVGSVMKALTVPVARAHVCALMARQVRGGLGSLLCAMHRSRKAEANRMIQGLEGYPAKAGDAQMHKDVTRFIALMKALMDVECAWKTGPEKTATDQAR